LFQHPQWIEEKTETMLTLDRSVAIRDSLSQSVNAGGNIGNIFRNMFCSIRDI